MCSLWGMLCIKRHTCFCRVYTWGWNKYGQLGSGTVENASMPAPVRTLTQKVTQVCIHSCGMVPEGALTLLLQRVCQYCALCSALQCPCCCHDAPVQACCICSNQ